MEVVAKFEKVSKQQFVMDWCHATGCKSEVASSVYERVKLPTRATRGSAGYDFFSPASFALAPDEAIIIPTGIRVNILDGWFLALLPRSSLGFKYQLQLNNTVGVIDSDYSNAENEGHIFIKITNGNRSGKSLQVMKGDGFVQGIFIPFGIVQGDEADEERQGGIGSSDE